MIFGGSGADSITAGNGNNVILGDNGEAIFTVALASGTVAAGNASYSRTLTDLETTAEINNGGVITETTSGGTVYGGNNTINVGNGNNVIFGGLGANVINAGNGANLVLGESGSAFFNGTTGIIQQVYSTYGGATVGGTVNTGTSNNDDITVGVGNNIVIGGAGSDQIVLGAGSDIVIGDDGEADFTGGVLTSIYSTDGALGYGGNNTISGPTVKGVLTPGGSGGSTIIGGLGANTIVIGGADNTIIGNDGEATFNTSGQLTYVSTTDPSIGGDNNITVTGGSNVIFGGAASDTITVQTGSTAPSGNIIVGDDGYANFANAILVQIATSNPSDYGNDIITAGNGDNVIMGGSGNNQITVGNGSNLILGANGEADFTAAGVLTTIKSTWASYAGEDTITAGYANSNPPGAGQNIVFGGSGADTITIYGNGNNIVLGDDGEADFTNGLLSDVFSTYVTNGSDNQITIDGNGANVVIGGVGANTITINGNGNNDILGVNGYVNFSGGYVLEMYTTSPTATDGSTSNDDTIKVGNGNNVILGGSGADVIAAGNGNNVIFGNDGQVIFANGVIQTMESTDTSIGGDNTITAGNGNDIVFGGIGANTITLGGGTDEVVGGNGFAQFSQTGILEAFYSIAPTATFGGTKDTGTSNNDIINVGNGNDAVIGGTGSDKITAGNGNDYIIGGNGEIQYTVVNGVNTISRAQSAYGYSFGNNTIVAGSGVDSIIGGSGSNNITTGYGPDDIVLGHDGEIVQAFNAAGGLMLNSDGQDHRDIVLEEIGTITGTVALDSLSDAASSMVSSSANAAALVSANLVLLAGAFNANGSQVILPAATGSRAAAAWETEALLLSLVPAGNDNITVGWGNGDVVIGQGGNNTITVQNNPTTGQGGNDILFGNWASNTEPFVSDIPSIVNAIVIAASNVAQIVVPVGGEIVVPSVNLEPSALTNSTPQLAMAPPGFGTLGALAGGGNLALSGSGSPYLTVYASVVPSVMNGSPALPGNNIINGGNGNDVIFGNFGQLGALPTTGIADIDAQMQGLSVTMLGLLTEYSALATAQDTLAVAQGLFQPFTVISAANNTINVGSGNNTVFADSGDYYVPGVAFAQMSTGTLATNAVALDTYLLDMQEVFADMSFVVHEAGQQVIASFAAKEDFSGVFNAKTPLRAAEFDLELGNEHITVNGNGNDTIVGDDGFVIMPGVGTTGANWAAGVSSATLATVNTQLNALESSFDTALKAQLTADHPFTASDSAAAQFLFNGGYGIELDIGNNTINGGGGASILIGGDALILDPVIAVGSSGSANSAALQATMVTAIDRLFLGAYSVAAATAESWGVTANLAASKSTDWSSSGGYVFNGATSASIEIDSSTINSGAGSDHIYGQLAVLLPQLGTATGVVTSFYAYASGELGGPSTANYNYVYGFGPFGSLQPWQANVTSPPKYMIDADTITGGAGADIIFGELGDDKIVGGSGNDQISGGWGFNTITGGTGTNIIAFDRATDTLVATKKGSDTAVSSLNVGAGSAILAVNWSTTLGAALAAGMTAKTQVAAAQKSTQVAVPPAILENLAPPAASATGAESSYFSATSIPPLDPDAPVFNWSVASQQMIGAATVITASSSGSKPKTTASANDLEESGADLLAQEMTDAEFADGGLASDGSGMLLASQDEATDIGSAQTFASTEDIIRTFRETEIVFKFSDAADKNSSDRPVWFFDDAGGRFVAGDPEKFTITIDGDANPLAQHRSEPAGTMEAASVASPGSSWLGALRQLGRAAASTWFDA